MRLFKAALTATVTAAVIGLVAGCSGNGSSLNSLTPNPTMHGAVARDGTGVAPKYLSRINFGHSLATRPTPFSTLAPRVLAVSDFGTGAIEILNHHYGLNTSIPTAGDGDWYDGSSHLYSANYSVATVTEYSGTTLNFTYTTGLGDPIGVTTDEAGNVYVADYGFGSAGFVTEYAQGSNTQLNTCSVNGGAEGVAVSETGKVFVAYNDATTGRGQILEFAHGLSGCHSTTLGASVAFAGGMQILHHNVLALCDQLGPTIDIINPPYSSVTTAISSGYGDPFHVAFNVSQGLMFVADVAFADVQVQAYPSGTLMTTLGSANGLSDPAGVASNPFQR